LADKKIKAILFDLGDTLLDFGTFDKSALFGQACRQTYAFLKQCDQPVGWFAGYYIQIWLGLYMRLFISKLTGNDFDSLEMLKKYGQKNCFSLSDEQWAELNWLWYKPIYRQSSIEEGLAATLGRLKENGLRLAIVSNTFVNAAVLDRHLEQENLTGFFEFRMYSYQFSFRKPDRRIFIEAAEKIGFEAEEIMFVGDRINLDIKGAEAVGMIPVLKNTYTNAGKETPNGLIKIDRIAELLELIEVAV
jgi:putative hydrolase of the HAD superfamily